MLFLTIFTLFCAHAHDSGISPFLSESETYPANLLSPNQLKVKVYREKRKIFMDAVYLTENIPAHAIKDTAFEVSRYDDIKVPGVVQAEKINNEVIWMHSETMGIHSQDYFVLKTYPDLEKGEADGFTWAPVKKEAKWEYKESSKFNDFLGSFYIKSVVRENSKSPMVYIRYAMMFDVDSVIPAFIIKAVVDLKGEHLSEDYIMAIVRAASLKAKAASLRRGR